MPLSPHLSTPTRGLSRGGFPKGRIALDPKNVPGCVHIAVMDRSAFAASPFSHTQTLSTFRAAPRMARRTGLRTVPLIGLDIFSPVRNRFVAEHRSEGRPTRVRDRFCQPGFHELCGINVTHNDAGVGFHKSRGLLMEMMPATGCDLRVDGSDAALVSSAARDGQLIFKVSEVARVLDARPVAENGQILQPEINADFSVPFDWGRLNLTNKIQKPSASGVGSKATAFDGFWNVARQKQVVFSFEKYGLVAIDFDDAAAGIKRHPRQGFSVAAIMRTTAPFTARFYEYAANVFNGARLKAKLFRAASSKFDEIKSRRPFLVVLVRELLNVAQIIPDEIYRPSLSRQFASSARCLHSISERQVQHV